MNVLPGVDGSVFALVPRDPDGAGPLPMQMVAGGQFQVAGAIAARRIAAWDPTQGNWSPLGSGTDGTVLALAVLPNGDLVAGGAFTTAGAVPANHIARWDGLGWSPLGTGLNGDVRALAVMPNGDVVAGGSFTIAGGVAASRVARWNGSSWSPLGSGVADTVHALATAANGDLFVGGEFVAAGGQPANHIARWDGTSWSLLGLGTDYAVFSLLAKSSGELLVGGCFFAAGLLTTGPLASWNGSAWSAVGPRIGSTPAGPFPNTSQVRALAMAPNGDVVVAGSFANAGALAVADICRWNGTNWNPLGSGLVQSVQALGVLPSGTFVAGGQFSFAGGSPAQGVAQWTGAWSPMPAVANVLSLEVDALQTLPSGELFAGGMFPWGCARWTANGWVSIGSGIFGQVTALAADGNDLIAAGGFPLIGNLQVNYVARWNGAAWSAIGTGLPGGASGVLAMGNGVLVAHGIPSFGSGSYLQRWNGTAWQPIGSPLGGGVSAMARTANGDLVVGGTFTSISGVATNGLATWNGSIWTSGPGSWPLAAVDHLAVLANGDLVASGRDSFLGSAASRVLRWDGVVWSQLGGSGDGQVTTLTPLPNGDLLAGGTFQFLGAASARLARWNGSAWASLGTGANSSILAATVLPTSEVVLGGRFTVVDGVVSSLAAQLTTTCPAQVAFDNPGCASSGGGNVLAAASLPWAGAVFRTRATGLPANAVSLAVFGFTNTALPLAALLPQGQTGCTLHVTPDVLVLVATSNGAAEVAWQLPNTPAIAGLALLQQMVPIEFGGAGSIVAITATNSLRFVAGFY